MDLKRLRIWKSSKQFCSKIYNITSNFPEPEKFGLTNQLRCASVSVPSKYSRKVFTKQ
ncbi:four helix bundle protein [Flavobacterium piscis]|uniref:four helix bundle protein n=1 Tax=Flavobacterium piscis TaxID=1114874 RepID=UPI00286A00F4|nr:four helix bundle protein [Flavobacterium piscis]